MLNRLSLFMVLLLASLAGSTLLGCKKQVNPYQVDPKVIEAQKKADDDTIQTYLTRHAITNYQRLNSGIYLVPITNGPATNPLIKAGQKVTVNYVGKFININREGQVFDASSTNRTDCGCFSFRNGGGGVIVGWDLATLEMRQGDRKLVIIPSYWAYGQPKADGSNAAFVNRPLLFDLEILNVE